MGVTEHLLAFPSLRVAQTGFTKVIFKCLSDTYSICRAQSGVAKIY